MKYYIFLFCFLSAVFLNASCKKEGFINSGDARLSLSSDTLKYDTVFVTAGSVTKSFKIFNSNDQKLLLSSVKLAGGASSAYRMNVNGVSSAEVKNISIAANDSVYVFVTVNVNPSTANLPFIISDSIAINYNGKTRFVQLQAYGQNAIFIRNGVISGNVNFTNTLPYVILEGLRVASGGTLIMNAGSKVYCHANAPLIIEGTMVCNGSKSLPVLFSGDRLDAPYINFPSSWPGIYFQNTAINNVMKFVQVRNAYRGISVSGPSQNSNPKLLIQQSLIDNAFDAGIYMSNSSLTAENSLISNCGKNIRAENGGSYSFIHCTSASYNTAYLFHKSPALYLSNTNESGTINPLNVLLRNSIMYGDPGFTDDDLVINKQGTGIFNVSVDHCIYRAAQVPANAIFTASFRNNDPLFDSLDAVHRVFNFRITKNNLSPAINNGIATGLLKDLDDSNRNNGIPDIGAYEKQ